MSSPRAIVNVELKMCGRAALIETLFDHYGPREFASPLRSTVPSLAFWSTPTQRIPQLCDVLGWDVPALCQIDFEHRVAPFAGKGKASHTDSMITWPGFAVAVEAKFTEGRYQTVEKWLGKNPTANRRNVLDGWVNKIAFVTGHKPAEAELLLMTYQALHRVASVCNNNEAKHRAVLYLIFSDENTGDDDYYNLLSRIRCGFRADDHIRMGVASVQVVPTGGYKKLIDEWKRTRQCNRRELRKLLLMGRLVTFKNIGFNLVGE